MYSVTLQQGVQGDGVLLPGSGVPPVHFPPVAADDIHRVPE